MQNLLLQEAAQIYCGSNSRICSRTTPQQYRFAVLAFERFLGQSATVADLTDANFARFLAARRMAVKSETLRGEASKLLALWRWCSGGKRRWIDGPEVCCPQPAIATPRALTREQLRRLFQAATDYPAHRRIGSVQARVYWPALLYLLWESSERIGAVYAIDRADIDLRGRWLTVPPGVRKGGRVGRAYRISRPAADALARLLVQSTFPRPFAERSLALLYRRFPELRKAAGLPPWLTFHTLRRSHASHLDALGGNARKSLGHSSEAVTARYLDPRITDQGRQPCEVLFDPLAGWLRRILG